MARGRPEPGRPREYDRRVAYDEALADRIRGLVADEPALTEQKMFGGLAFLVGGNMAVAASGQGGILVHVDPAEGAALVATTPAEPMVMRGREMKGWLRVDTADVAADGELGAVGRARRCLRALPACQVAAALAIMADLDEVARAVGARAAPTVGA